MSTSRRNVWQDIHERDVYRILLSSGSAKPTFSYLVRELAKNIGTPIEEGMTPGDAARRIIGGMVAKSDVAVDDDGRFHIT